MPFKLLNQTIQNTMKKESFSIYRVTKPADASSMASRFTGGVPLTLAFLQSAVNVLLANPFRLYTDELKLAFFFWLMQCKQAGQTPHVVINISGASVNWYRSDTHQPILKTNLGAEPIRRSVNFAASFGITIDNAWHGSRPTKDGHDVGWWFDVPVINKSEDTALASFLSNSTSVNEYA